MKKETPFGAAVKESWRLLAEHMIKKLTVRGHTAFYAETAEKALEKILELIPAGASVGVPGTVTVRELGAIEALQARGSRVVHHWIPGATPDERDEARFAEFDCDALLVSSNAITKDGVMVNIDGSGNRLAAMCWSRGDRIFVVSMNKVCPDVESAVKRVRECATPPNAVRQKMKSPCAVNGCHADGGCIGPQSLCRTLLITEQAPFMPFGKKSYVILVGEPLGY
ncbi:MAG: lactate utilization protein [Pyramidobacter sp.]|nr:lactate utilization protein [Pyramidobacter sp.]